MYIRIEPAIGAVATSNTDTTTVSIIRHRIRSCLGTDSNSSEENSNSNSNSNSCSCRNNSGCHPPSNHHHYSNHHSNKKMGRRRYGYYYCLGQYYCYYDQQLISFVLIVCLLVLILIMNVTITVPDLTVTIQQQSQQQPRIVTTTATTDATTTAPGNLRATTTTESSVSTTVRYNVNDNNHSNNNVEESLLLSTTATVATVTVPFQQQQQQQQSIRSYPRWGTTIEDEDKVGISFVPFWNFVMTSSKYYYTEINNDDNDNNTTTTTPTRSIVNHPYYRPTLDHGILQPTTLAALPEILYTIEPSTATIQMMIEESNKNSRTNDIHSTSSLYVPKLYGSNSHRQIHVVRSMRNKKRDEYDKLIYTERAMLYALHLLHKNIVQLLLVQQKQPQHYSNDTNICQYSSWSTLCATLYPSLTSSLRTNHNTETTTSDSAVDNVSSFPTAGGFPFLAWYGDYIGCNYHNWEMAYEVVDDDHETSTGTARLQPRTDPILHTAFRRGLVPSTQLVSIPLFTVAANTECNYTIPFPNYDLSRNSVDKVSEWDPIMDEKQLLYPWTEKKSLVVWRGALSGHVTSNETKCPRWKMMEAIHTIHTQRQLNPKISTRKEMFDAKVIYVPHITLPYLPDIERDIGGSTMISRKYSMNFDDFQTYRAILDVDGNSWSGRFTSLLCLNSIILKVDPNYHEYFQARRTTDDNNYEINNDRYDENDQRELLAWKHYVPIKNDFSNLEEAAEFVLDPKNDAAVLNIIQNANHWCRTNKVHGVIAKDMLDIWDRYVHLLNTNDTNWSHLYWNKQNKKEKIYINNDDDHATTAAAAAGSSFQMIDLELFYNDPTILTKEDTPFLNK